MLKPLLAGVVLVVLGQQRLTVDLDKIIKLESSGNHLALNCKTGARGLLQITPIVLFEFNNYHRTKNGGADLYQLNDLYVAKVNIRVGTWYLKKRIPQLLRAYEEPLTLRNVLICWNAGIYYVNEKGVSLPYQTQRFIEDYENKKI
jgi:soluble lytic murein transglycosylase-like protein